MGDVRYQEIGKEEAGQRLDNFLLRVLKGVPKSHVYRIIRGGEVRVNKKRAQAATRLAVGDMIRIPPVRTSIDKEVWVSDNAQQRLQGSIIYEDNQLLVINKPAGIAVHGGSGLSYGVIEALRKMRSDLTYLELVHRLDKETSGCLLLAKKRSTLRSVQALLEAREVTKVYWALLLHTWYGKKSVLVDRALEKNTLKSGERMVTLQSEGKSSQTQFTLLENFRDACFVEACPKTGRTHQIRVHSVSLGHPIVGDTKYGEENAPPSSLTRRAQRLYLHARAIQFNLNGENRTFQADLDSPFCQALETLRNLQNQV